MMVTAASAERLLPMRRHREHMVIVREYAKETVTTSGVPSSEHSKLETPTTRLAAMRERTNARVCSASGDNTKTTEIRHELTLRPGMTGESKKTSPAAVTHLMI